MSPPKGIVPPQLRSSLFTKGDKGNRWSFIPQETSPMWEKLTAKMSYRAGQATMLRLDPMLGNIASIKTLKNAEKVGFSAHTERALKEVGEYLTETVINRYFADEGVGKSLWRELAPATVRARGSAHPILNETGELKMLATSSLAVEEIKLGKEPRIRLGGGNFPGDNAAKYFVHMTGGPYGWGGAHIPRRKFMPTSQNDLTNYDKKHIKDIFRIQIMKLMEEG